MRQTKTVTTCDAQGCLTTLVTSEYDLEPARYGLATVPRGWTLVYKRHAEEGGREQFELFCPKHNIRLMEDLINHGK